MKKNEFLTVTDGRKFHIPTLQAAIKTGALSRKQPERHPALPAFLEWEAAQPKPSKKRK